MIVAESRRGRRLIGRIDRGAELVSSLLQIARDHGVRTAELRGLGTLATVELRDFDTRQKRWGASRRFAGPLTLVSLGGNLSELGGQLHVEASALCSRGGDNGVEVLGGMVVRAEVVSVEFVIEVCDDVFARRAADPATGLEPWSELHAESSPSAATASAGDGAAPRSIRVTPSPAADLVTSQSAIPDATPASTEAEPPSSTAAWQAVVEASARQPPVVVDDEPPPEPPLSAGDLIDHPKFGRCEVEKIEGDAEFAQVRLRNGRLVRLSLDVLQVERAGREGARRTYRVVPK